MTTKTTQETVATQAATRTAGRAAAPSGFTLTELMVVVTILAIMAAMSAPSFQRAVEQSRADIAAANLRAIWAAERLYWLEYQSYTTSSHLETLRDLGLVDSEVVTSTGGYSYTVTPSPWKATATSEAPVSATITIDENGKIQSSGITPAFQ